MSESSWRDARGILTDSEVIEACLVVGHYQGLARAIGGLAIEPGVPRPDPQTRGRRRLR
jgi:hypothetical protein